MKYAALLRGINVGGKNKVEMAKLKQVFEELDCTDVASYINSGNIVFVDKRTAKTLQPLIEKALKSEFKLDIPVVLRDEKNIAKLCADIPAKWTNDKDHKTDVIFLWDKIDSKAILEEISFKSEYEEVKYLPGALVWTIDRSYNKPGTSVKLVGTEIYKSMTIRNVNTVRKLESMMKDIT